MAKIDSITMYDSDNYVSYNDSDSMTDYFHGYSLGVATTIEWLKKDGADAVRVRANGDFDSRDHKRAKRIAKGAGYDLTLQSKTYPNGVTQTWYEFTRQVVAQAA